MADKSWLRRISSIILLALVLVIAGCSSWCKSGMEEEDTGDRWRKMYGYMENIKSMVVAADSVYVGGSQGEINKLLPDGMGSFNRSITTQNYSGSGTPYSSTITSLALNPAGTLFAGTSDHGIYKHNGGVNWGNWIECSYNSPPVPGHVMDMTNGAQGRMFAVTEHEIFRSLDQGDSWDRIYSATADTFSSIVVDSSNNAIFVGFNGGVLKSLDNGDNWTNMTQGNTQLQNTVDLAVSNYPSPRVYALTVSNLYVSPDSANSWYVVPDASTFPAGHVFTSLCILSIGGADEIFLGSSTTGVSFKKLSTNDWTTDNNSQGLNTSAVYACGAQTNVRAFVGTANGAYLKTK